MNEMSLWCKKSLTKHMEVSSLQQMIKKLIFYKDSTGKSGLWLGSIVSGWL